MTGSTINVMVLGEEGSGKTLYLAGLYRQLSYDSIKTVVTLSPNNVHTRLLDRLYEQVTSVEDSEFPMPTAWGVDIWSFECSVFAGDGERLRAFPIFTINYADYAGEMLGGAHLGAQELDDNEGIKRFDETTAESGSVHCTELTDESVSRDLDQNTDALRRRGRADDEPADANTLTFVISDRRVTQQDLNLEVE
jgi:hypothetical protein